MKFTQTDKDRIHRKNLKSETAKEWTRLYATGV